MKYVALLRGINVGGKNKVDMKLLCKTFERVGCTDIVTYINSGNIVFTSADKPAKLQRELEKYIEKDFGFHVRVLLRDQQNIALLNTKIPQKWTNDTERKTDVLFLWDEIDNEDILHRIATKPELETVQYLPGAVVWTIAREHVTRGSMVKIVGTDIYKHMTVRNINTVRKIHGLMNA